MTKERAASPYDTPELYDRMLDGLDFDQAFWLSVARGGGGPLLEVACGTGRVLTRLLEAGIDADGIDNAPPMLERARARAAALGKHPALVEADMREFSLPRRYARVICAFNGFAHMLTPDDQIRALRCMREHLAPGGAAVVFMSYPRPVYWSQPDGEPVLELEMPLPGGDHRVQMWDTRFKDVTRQCQRSQMEIREIDSGGSAVASHRSETVQRWVYRYEMELLMRLAGFARSEMQGGFEGEPFEDPDQPLIAWGWTS